ncbi:MAG: hypothetical protein Kow00121_02540 [Elainellaceae cyanobacterium]
MLPSPIMKSLGIASLSLIAGTLGAFGIHDRLHAAEQLIVTYGAFEASFAIADLETLATTGEVPTSMDFYLGLANLDPEQLRAILTAKFDVTLGLLDDMLNSEGGEYMLSEITQVVHTPSSQANVQALRSAFVMAASDDQQISLLELLQNYPTQQVYINGINLIRLAQDFNQEPIADGTAD